MIGFFYTLNYLGHTPSPWRDVKVVADHAYIVAEAQDHGMQVFDLNRLRDLKVSHLSKTNNKMSSSYVACAGILTIHGRPILNIIIN